MEILFSLSSFLYCLFFAFVSIQQLHVQHYKGESQLMELFLNAFVFLSSIVGVVYMGFLWYHSHWYLALGVFLVGIFLGGGIGRYLGRKFGYLYISFCGFLTIPILGWLMFKYIY